MDLDRDGDVWPTTPTGTLDADAESGSLGLTRIARACTRCRRIKRRCSGTVPCHACQKSGRTDECIYEPPSRNNSSKPAIGLPLSCSIKRKTPIFGPFFDSAPTGPALHQGPAGALSFLDLVQEAIFGPDRAHEKASIRRAADARPLAEMSEAELFSLPPRDQSDALVDVFFSIVNRYIPILHRGTFNSDYHLAWTQVGRGERPSTLFMALLNIIYAGGLQFGDSLPGDESTYLERNKALLALADQEDPSPSLLGATVHLLRVHVVIARHAVIGSGEDVHLCRAASHAVLLGLYAQPKPDEFDAVMVERRKRVFHCIYALSIHVGLLIGAQPLTHAVRPTVDLPADFPNEPSSSVTEYFRAWCGLTVCLDRIHSELYEEADLSSATAMQDPADFGLLLKLEDALEEWRKSLPAEWSLEGHAEDMQDLKQILRLRYTWARLMLTRPSMTRMLQSRLSSTERTQLPGITRLRSMAWHNAEQLCVEAAKELMEASHKLQGNSYFRCCRFYTIDYTFLGAVVLLAARWRGHTIDNFDHYWKPSLALIYDALPVIASRLECLEKQFHIDQIANGAGDDVLAAFLSKIHNMTGDEVDHNTTSPFSM